MTVPCTPDVLFVDPVQPTWHRPKVRGACGRDPAAGPGACFYWWEGCPEGEKRGCYGLWLESIRPSRRGAQA